MCDRLSWELTSVVDTWPSRLEHRSKDMLQGENLYPWGELPKHWVLGPITLARGSALQLKHSRQLFLELDGVLVTIASLNPPILCIVLHGASVERT